MSGLPAARLAPLEEGVAVAVALDPADPFRAKVPAGAVTALGPEQRE